MAEERQFTMSMYASKEALYKAKAEYYQKRWVGLRTERDALAKNQVWYSTALGKLGPLRSHLADLIQTCEGHNRAAVRLGHLSIPGEPLERHKQALQEAEDFFTHRKEDEARQETVTCSICHQPTPASTAHLHQEDWIGECCWDDRLKSSE